MDWKSIVGQVSFAGLLIAALVYLAKRISEQYFSKDLEKFKAELRTAAFEREIRIQKLHERRAEVIADLYAKLADTHSNLISFLSPYEFKGEASKQEKGKIAT